MPGTKTSGNRSARRGRKLRRDIHLSEGAARSLRVLLMNAQGVRNRPDLTEDDLVEELIDRAWRQLDAHYQEGVIMDRREFWQHKSSGDRYVVVTVDGAVSEAAGPLSDEEIQTICQEHWFDNNVETAAWVADPSNQFHVIGEY